MAVVIGEWRASAQCIAVVAVNIISLERVGGVFVGRSKLMKLVGLVLVCLLAVAGTNAMSEPQPSVDPVTAPPPGAAPAGDLAYPARPAEPMAAKAYDVLKTHCARCHQVGLLDRPEASGRLANILEIDVISREANLLRPGHPDASPIYLSMLTQEMPPHEPTEGLQPRPGQRQHQLWRRRKFAPFVIGSKKCRSKH